MKHLGSTLSNLQNVCIRQNEAPFTQINLVVHFRMSESNLLLRYDRRKDVCKFLCYYLRELAPTRRQIEYLSKWLCLMSTMIDSDFVSQIQSGFVGSRAGS